ncbi:MAG: transglutaminase family protein [Deltaproteobacteria bacterium]|nr:transglutaminase family protein [Deltaproteobacteria bacterium]
MKSWASHWIPPEKLDNARRLIYELDNIIINPSIDQIDSVLKLIEILDPEVQGEILATKPELPNRTVDTKVNAFKVRPVKATGAPVTDADLAETPEIVFTEAIIAKAAELNHDVVDIFTWVRFNIDYEPYYGSMKGSNETLVDMAGNDCDQSSFLLALLRASGIPSRYVRGDVELKIEDLMNWTGGKTPEAAVAIMQRNKIPTTIIYKFDAIEGVIFDHIWVEAFDGHNWRLMDPSFKTYIYTEGMAFDLDDSAMASFADSISEVNENIYLIDHNAMKTSLEAQGDWLKGIAGNSTVGEFL